MIVILLLLIFQISSNWACSCRPLPQLHCTNEKFHLSHIARVSFDISQ